MTVESLKDCTKKTLVRMARELGIAGWHAMRKDQLIRVLSEQQSSKKSRSKLQTSATNNSSAARTKPEASRPKRDVADRRQTRPTKRSAGGSTKPRTTTSSRLPNTFGKLRKTIVPTESRTETDLNAHSDATTRDRIIAMVRGPYWLQVHWELSRSTLQRAQAAMGKHWHTARPILRVVDVTSDEITPSSERHVRDILIHGGVSDWFIDVLDPPRSYRIEIGYRASCGKFFVLARSNRVSTPPAHCTDTLEQDWSSVRDDYEKFYEWSGGSGPDSMTQDLRELFEERLRQPMHTFSLQSPGRQADALEQPGRFHFSVDAELIVYGSTDPAAKVMLQDEPISLRPDGTFTVRFSLPDARQIIPAVATSVDGVEERTIVLAIERNTKELEPQINDGQEV